MRDCHGRPKAVPVADPSSGALQSLRCRELHPEPRPRPVGVWKGGIAVSSWHWGDRRALPAASRPRVQPGLGAAVG